MSSLHHFLHFFLHKSFRKAPQMTTNSQALTRRGKGLKRSDTNDFRGFGCSGRLTPGGQTLSNLLIHSETW